MTWELHLGDCLDPITGLASLADKSVDHVICDPPYEVEAHTKQRKRSDVSHGRIASPALNFEPMTEATRIESARQAARVAKKWLLFFCQIEVVGLWRDALVEAGAKYRRAIIWVKPDAAPQFTGDRPAQGFELACLGWAGDGRSVWNGGGRRGVYECLTGRNSNGHPTEKPEALMERLVRDFTRPGDIILDPFAGSGTTGVAAVRNGRRFIGWEKDLSYYATAMRRLGNAREQLSMFGGAA